MTRKRRDPYERALNAAVKRLEKARQEQDRCTFRLSQLGEEIPRLEQIIAVLGTKQPYPATESIPVGEVPNLKDAPPPPLTHPGLPGGVPAHLEKYLRRVIHPPAAQTAELPPAPDEEDNLPAIPGDPILE